MIYVQTHTDTDRWIWIFWDRHKDRKILLDRQTDITMGRQTRQTDRL